MNLTPFCSMDCSCDEALQWTQRRLSRAGLRVMRTFDLGATRARHALDDCQRPFHGMDACDCQMVVLLVYGKADQPITLILHGNGDQSWFSIADNPGQRAEDRLTEDIKRAVSNELTAPFAKG